MSRIMSKIYIGDIDENTYWWRIERRKNMIGADVPNPTLGTHLYVVSIGRHDAESKNGAVAGQGMTAAKAFSDARRKLP